MNSKDHAVSTLNIKGVGDTVGCQNDLALIRPGAGAAQHIKRLIRGDFVHPVF